MATYIVLIVFVASYLCKCAFAQVLCSNPLIIGELRNLKSKQCVDISGYDGAGSIQTEECEGYSDQQIILCGDGTIRNEAKNYCFTPEGTGNVDVESSPCTHYPRIPDSQKWRLGREIQFKDVGGIVQVAREIINIASGKCLDISGYDGYGDIKVNECQNLTDQYFYFRSRGKQLARGRLINEKSNQCLDVDGHDGEGDVEIYDCEDELDQWFRYYENGEVINERSGQCLDVSGHDGTGNIQIYPCEDRLDQMWLLPKSLCNGEYCSFLNKESSKCLDVWGYDGKGWVRTDDCEGLPDQRLKFVSDKWTAPTAKWVLIGCNQNGKVSQWISNSVTFSKTITKTITTEVSASIEADLIFAKAAVSTRVSTSLSTAWSQSQSSKTRIMFSCDQYDSHDPFTSGCMWQLQVIILWKILKYNTRIYSESKSSYQR